MQSIIKASARNSERGIFVILFAVTIVAIVMIVSLVIDLGKQELSLAQIHHAADAAALSGARQLNGRPDGWRAAKLAAATVLRRYPIHGVDTGSQGNLHLTGGSHAFWDRVPQAVPDYAVDPIVSDVGVSGRVGAFHVVVERGIIRAKPGAPDETEFVSLEENASGEIMSGDSYLFANAVRVDAGLDYLPGIFTRIFGSLGFFQLQARSYAIMHSEMDRVVAPIAIAYEDLLLDTNPLTPSQRHILPTYTPEFEYPREIAVRVLNATGRSDMLGENRSLDPDPLGRIPPRQFINEGLTRANSFPRKPLVQFYKSSKFPQYPPDVCFQGTQTIIDQNCKAIPMDAYFALPGVEAVTPEMIVSAFEQGGVRARIGDTVGGLMNLGTLATEPALSQRLAEAINASPTTFASFFINGDGSTKPNYPMLKSAAGKGVPINQDPVVEQTYPSDSAWGKRQLFLLGEMAHQSPGDPPWQTSYSGAGVANFVSPMCHFDGVPVNDPARNRVREVFAMVVAPQRSQTASGKKIRYRDFSGMFSGGFQSAIAEVKETIPTIVGFVRIGVFDGNTLALNVRFPLPAGGNPDAPIAVRTSTPHYGDPSTNNYVVDNNPAALDLKNTRTYDHYKNYSGKVEIAYKCYDDSDPGDREKCEDPGPAPQLDGFTAFLMCFDFAPYREQFGKAMEEIGDGSNLGPCCVKRPQDCGFDDAKQCKGCSGDKIGCCDRICYGKARSHTVDDLYTKLRFFFEKPVKSIPDTHCLYNLLPDSTDMNQLSSYDALHPLSPGFGCAGLRARLAHLNRRKDDWASFVSATTWSRQSPTLVNVSK